MVHSELRAYAAAVRPLPALDLPALTDLGSSAPGVLAIGFVTAGVSGYLAVRIVWRVMERGQLAIFAPYCALLGLAVLVWSFVGQP